MASYNGPATIVSPRDEIDVTVDLQSGTDPDGRPTWRGHVDCCDGSRLLRAVHAMSAYGLVIRLPDGREGNFLPSSSLAVSGFMRG
jgi:hypothetical protein